MIGFNTRLAAIALATALALLAAPAWAQSDEACGDPEATPMDMIFACGRLIDAGDTGENMAIYYTNRGTAHYKLGNLDDAMADYEAAIRANPGDSFPYVGRANIHAARGDFERAVADFDRALAIDPRDAAALGGRGALRADAGMLDEGLADVDRAIALDPKDATFFSVRANIQLRRREYAKAVADADEAVRLSPAAEFLNYRCWTRAVWGQELDKALADCNAALAQVADANTYDSLGLLQLKRGKFAEAEAAYDQSVRLDPDMISALYGRGLARVRLGQRAAGEADMAAATRRDPRLPELFAGYGVRP